MTRTQFDVYHTAFANLLACASSSEPVKVDAPGDGNDARRTTPTCAVRWITDLGALLDADGRKRVAPMLDYYLRTVLHSPARNANC
jgi:hypothetical protein